MNHLRIRICVAQPGRRRPSCGARPRCPRPRRPGSPRHTAQSHHLGNERGERLYPGGGLAPAGDTGAVDVVGGQIGEGSEAAVLFLGAHRPARARRERQVDAHAGLDAGLLIGAEHVVVLTERLAFPFPLVKVEDPAGLDGEVRVAGEDPRPVLPGLEVLISEPAAHRRRRGQGRDAAAAAFRASSGHVQRASGVPLAAGISHARALTPATTAAGNTRGLPERGASESPSRPFSQYRRRHLRAVSSQTPSSCARSCSSRRRLPRAGRCAPAAPAGTGPWPGETGTPAERAGYRQGI